MKKEICYLCKKPFKKNEWKYSFNEGLCCYKCKDLGKILQSLSLFKERMRERKIDIQMRKLNIIDNYV